MRRKKRQIQVKKRLKNLKLKSRGSSQRLRLQKAIVGHYIARKLRFAVPSGLIRRNFQKLKASALGIQGYDTRTQTSPKVMRADLKMWSFPKVPLLMWDYNQTILGLLEGTFENILSKFTEREKGPLMGREDLFVEQESQPYLLFHLYSFPYSSSQF